MTFLSRISSLAVLLWLATAVGHLPAADAVLYRCPMHPSVTSPRPGKCTICGMALVAATAADASPTAGVVALSPSSITTIGVETSTVARQPLTRTLRITGRIED